MKCGDEAIRTIEHFLISQGFDAEKETVGVEDGHWILARIRLLCRACCEDSFEAGLRNALDKLQSGAYITGEPAADGRSQWSKENTEEVLAQAGLLSKKGHR